MARLFDEDEGEVELRINPDYATHYEARKDREDLVKLSSKYTFVCMRGSWKVTCNSPHSREEY